MNSFIKELNIKENSKGGLYHENTFDSNLDLFATKGRNDDWEDLDRIVQNAWIENKELAVKNVLNFLDIRGGKGERRAAKLLIGSLLTNRYEEDKELLNKLIDNIGELGRWDYLVDIAVGGNGHEFEKYAIDLIKKQLDKDIKNHHNNLPISLLAKWLPSINASSANTRVKARYLIKALGFHQSEADYRLMLSSFRKYLNVLEVNMSAKTYENVDYSKVPSQALRKHVKAFYKNDKERYEDYKDKLSKGETKANAGAIYPSQIVHDVMRNNDIEISNGQWNNLPNFFETDKNVLVVADVSCSMGYGYCPVLSPIHSSIALALYAAQRNKGAFYNKFLTFSADPKLTLVTGRTLSEKVNSISRANWGVTTDIDKVFQLILKATLRADKKDCPEYLIIVSDMEFDKAKENNTNFQQWKNEFANHGLTLPKIVFWNVAAITNGFPVTKFEDNVAMVSGDSPSIISKLFNLEDLSPTKMMIETLAKYDKYLA